MNDLELKLYDWIENFVEVPNKNLNGWSPCPYARKARLEKKIKIVIAEGTEIFKTVFSNIECLNQGYEVIVYCFDKSIEPSYFVNATLELNRHKSNSGFIFLEDHPSIKESINGVEMNFGECALILAQKVDLLNDSSTQLKKKGYYDVWTRENLEDVVEWRNK